MICLLVFTAISWSAFLCIEDRQRDQNLEQSYKFDKNNKALDQYDTSPPRKNPSARLPFENYVANGRRQQTNNETVETDQISVGSAGVFHPNTVGLSVISSIKFKSIMLDTIFWATFIHAQGEKPVVAQLSKDLPDTEDNRKLWMSHYWKSQRNLVYQWWSNTWQFSTQTDPFSLP